MVHQQGEQIVPDDSDSNASERTGTPETETTATSLLSKDNVGVTGGGPNFDHPLEPPRDLSGSKQPVAWMDLPRKKQLVIITLARMSEPLVQTSLQVQ